VQTTIRDMEHGLAGYFHAIERNPGEKYFRAGMGHDGVFINKEIEEIMIGIHALLVRIGRVKKGLTYPIDVRWMCTIVVGNVAMFREGDIEDLVRICGSM
jgi:hypothetical protein